MECRTSLFIQNNQHQKPAHNTPSWIGNAGNANAPSTPIPISPRDRYEPTHSKHRKRETHYAQNHNIHQTITPSKKQPLQSVEPIPLPIPKNHVMISLMEAAQRKERALMNKNIRQDSYSYDSDRDENDDIQYVLDGIEVISSSCGTYVVKDNEGLAVFPGNPIDMAIKRVPSYFKSPPMVRFGQKVQVAAMIEHGVYKLARNEGYIVANETQLAKGKVQVLLLNMVNMMINMIVKIYSLYSMISHLTHIYTRNTILYIHSAPFIIIVGMPLEKSCQLEGMLSSIQSSKENLTKQMSDLAIAETNLKEELHEILNSPPEYPVIDEYKPIESSSTEMETPIPSQDSLFDKRLEHKMTLEIRSFSEESVIGTPTPSSPPEQSELGRQVLFLNDDVTSVSDTVLQSTMQRSESPLTTRIGSQFICGGSLFPILSSTSDDEEDKRIPRYRPNPEIQGSPRNSESVDFRTGMSGHIALNRKKKVNTQNRRPEVRMMGEHRGIASSRKIRNLFVQSPRRL